MRSARDRGREFGERHPRLTIVISCVLLAGVTAACGYQLSYGTYLGRGWLIAAVGGVATAGGLSAAALVSTRRHGRATGRVAMAWMVLGVMSASALRYPFPVGPYGSVQAFFNVVHAALLGYEAVTCAAIISLLVYRFTRLHSMPGRVPLQRPPVRSWTAPGGQKPDYGGLPARHPGPFDERFPARLRLEAPAGPGGRWLFGAIRVRPGSLLWEPAAGVHAVPADLGTATIVPDGAGRDAKSAGALTVDTAAGRIQLEFDAETFTLLQHIAGELANARAQSSADER